MGWDAGLLEWINKAWACAALDGIMPAFHVFWPFALAFAPLLVWMLLRNRPITRREVLGCVILVLITNMVAADVIKPIVDRDRPCRTIEGVRVLTPTGNCPSSDSFPSAHAANLFAAAAYLSWRRRRRGWILFPFAALIAVSRIYMGVHWPSDALAGALLGLSTGIAAALIHGLISPEKAPEIPPEIRIGKPTEPFQ